MKNITLINNEWKQRFQPQLAEGEKQLLLYQGSEHNESKQALIRRITAESLVAADPEDAATAQVIYEAHKIEDAQLIAVDILLPSRTGIINCRINGEHKQIRF